MSTSFQLLASHPVLDFVNTLDNRFSAKGPTELLGEYADLVRFAQESQLLDAEEAAQLMHNSASRGANALRQALEMREDIAKLFYRFVGREPPSAKSLTALARACQVAEQQRELTWAPAAASAAKASARACWRWPQGAGNALLPVWILTSAAVELLTSPSLSHVHACESPTCRWLFLDITKNHSRRWCDMKICGNRSKARRFQSRRR